MGVRLQINEFFVLFEFFYDFLGEEFIGLGFFIKLFFAGGIGAKNVNETVSFFGDVHNGAGLAEPVFAFGHGNEYFLGLTADGASLHIGLINMIR